MIGQFVEISFILIFKVGKILTRDVNLFEKCEKIFIRGKRDFGALKNTIKKSNSTTVMGI